MSTKKDIQFFIKMNSQGLKTISENFGQLIEKSKTQPNRYKELGAQEIPPSSDGMTVLPPPPMPMPGFPRSCPTFVPLPA